MATFGKKIGKKNLIQNVSNMRWTFVFSFAFIFFISFSVLNTVGITPELDEGSIEVARAADDLSNDELYRVEDPLPNHITIPSVGIDVQINNPTSRDINVLDGALLTGAVHYPGSGNLFDTSNIFIFGHSSYVPLVNNNSFRAFNNLQKVKENDVIRVYSHDAVNIYHVDSVRLVAASEALVELGGSEKKLTLSTCNSFGDPGERYIVEASFVETRAL